MILSVPYEGYSRNRSCALNSISMSLFIYIHLSPRTRCRRMKEITERDPNGNLDDDVSTMLHLIQLETTIESYVNNIRVKVYFDNAHT